MSLTFNPFTGNLDFTGTGGGGGGTPALPFNSVQFNNAGAFGGSANLTWDGTEFRVNSALFPANFPDPPSGTDTYSPLSGIAQTLTAVGDPLHVTYAPAFGVYANVNPSADDPSSTQYGAIFAGSSVPSSNTKVIFEHNTLQIRTLWGGANGITNGAENIGAANYVTNSTPIYHNTGYLANVFSFADTTATFGTYLNASNGAGHTGIQASAWLTSTVNGATAVTDSLYGAYVDQPTIGSGGTVTTLVGYYASALGGIGATNAFTFWANEPGVWALHPIKTFNNVYQARPALYNPQFTQFTAGAANYERIVEQWESNVAVITTEAGGSGTLRGLRLGDASVPLFLGPLTSNGFVKTSGGTGALSIDTSTYLTTAVTSVGLSLPNIFTISGSPVTTTGTLTGSLATQSANLVWAGPSSGAAATPTFRALVSADLPAGTGTVTSIGTTSPISGGTITTMGTLSLLVNVDFLFTHSQTITPGAAGQGGLTITGATETATNPALNITQTWNASGTTFTASKLNVTNTASAVGSLLEDLQLGGTSRWNVGLGLWTATSGTNVAATLAPSFAPTSTSTMVAQGLKIAPTINYSAGTPGAGNYEALRIAVTETANPTGTNYLLRASAGSAGTTDKLIVRNDGRVDSAFNSNNGVAFSVGVLLAGNVLGFGRNTSVGGMNLHGGGTSSPSDTNAAVLVSGSTGASPVVILDSGLKLGWSLSNVTQSQDTILLRAAAATVQHGSDTNGAAVNQQLQAANGITGTDRTGGNFTFASGKGTGAGAVSSLIFQTPTVLASGTTAQSLATRFTIASGTLTIADATNLAVGTSTGTQIATTGGASGQKLGFFAATPIVQPLLATGAGHTADDIITTLQNLGLCRQS